MHVRVGLIAANATELHRGGHRGIVLVAEVAAGVLAEEVVEVMEELTTEVLGWGSYWVGDLSVWVIINNDGGFNLAMKSVADRYR